MQELELLKGLRDIFASRNQVAISIGDDCAAIDHDAENFQLLASDQLISGVHFSNDTPVEKIAAKLLKRNLSDIAAMGGYPQQALLNLALAGYSKQWILRFFAALEKCAEEYKICICGGDLAGLNKNSHSKLFVGSLAITGMVSKKNICLRSNAENGDLLCVTGTLGDSLHSGKHLDFVPRLAEAQFLAGGYTKCMIDISDGLLLDASRLAEASKLDLEFFCSEIPRNNCSLQQALGDGEDYELLFSVRSGLFEKLAAEWPFDTEINKIGRFKATSNSQYRVYDSNSKEQLCKNFKSGYTH